MQSKKILNSTYQDDEFIRVYLINQLIKQGGFSGIKISPFCKE